MKKEFSWYFKPDKNELDDIWKNGILTVDANLLLDLYRYHENTRDSILNSLKKHEGPLWLSRQASEEFFKNRNAVIVSARKTFQEANDEVEKLRSTIEKAVTQLKGNRLIPEDLAQEMLSSILPPVNAIKDKIIALKDAHPNYIREDPVLEVLAELFNSSVGRDFTEEEKKIVITEAITRQENKIPPGYLDNEKDGDRPYGDFFMWRQILDKAKTEAKPIILVTSERKEDWWEKISGRTIGPRLELVKEAVEYSGQRVLIYQTDRFLEFSSQRIGEVVDEKAVEEIRAVDTLRAERQLAVRLISQEINEGTATYSTGTLTLQILRSVANFTGSGHFDPIMNCSPNVTAELISAPSDISNFNVKVRTGTNYDFNVHVTPCEKGYMLPTGDYTFKYTANCISRDEEHKDINT
ncbi:PIN-like domain-containing protein [Aeromonas caviae]